MITKTVKVSEKGQIAIPREIRNAMDLEKGDELIIIIQKDNRIVLEKAEHLLEDVFDDLLKASEHVAKELWDNTYDEVWNSV